MLHRFNEADKWFACATFENAMQSEQARNRHFSPTSEVAFEVSNMLIIKVFTIVSTHLLADPCTLSEA